VTQSAAFPAFHAPVLAREVAQLLDNARHVLDCTLGGGGHALAFLEKGARVTGIDQDPAAIAAAARVLEAHERSGAFNAIRANFSEIDERPEFDGKHWDGILLDLGVSSHQLDAAARGFTFRPGAPLDMRMTPARGPSAADVLNSWPETRLAAAFADDADEPRARTLARVVVRRRARGPFLVSDDLVNAIREVRGARAGPDDFARLFQAIRIAVNEERAQLADALPAFRDALVPGGRLGVISYHSGEDRAAKQAFREWARACVCPPRQPVCNCRGRPLGTVLTKRPITPGPEELAANPRSRSAKFRAFAAGAATHGD